MIDVDVSRPPQPRKASGKGDAQEGILRRTASRIHAWARVLDKLGIRSILIMPWTRVLMLCSCYIARPPVEIRRCPCS